MKKPAAILMLTILSILAFSCKEENEDVPEYKNGFTVYGAFHETDQAFYFNEDGMTEVVFLSSSVRFDQEGQFWTGTGDGVDFFSLYSNTASGVPVGSYSLDTTGNTNTFEESWIMLDYDFRNEEGSEQMPASGALKITSKGDGYYLFEYTLAMGGSSALTGTWIGKPVDISSMLQDGKKSAAACPGLERFRVK